MRRRNKALWPALAMMLALALLCGCEGQTADVSSDITSAQSSVAAISPPVNLETQLPLTLSMEGKDYPLQPKRVKITAEQWQRTYLIENPTVTLTTTHNAALTVTCSGTSTGELLAFNEEGGQVVSTGIEGASVTLKLPKEIGLYKIQITAVTQKEYAYWQQFEFFVKQDTIPVSSAAVSSVSASGQTDKPVIMLSADTISPGDTIAVKIKGYNGSNLLYARFANVDNRTFPLTRTSDGSYIGFAAISTLTTKPGALQIYGSENGTSGATLITSKNLTVQKKSFKRQDLTVEPGSQMESAGSSENLDSDKAIIAKVTANPAKELYCEGPFIQPVDGRITTQFGQMRYTNGEFTSSHSGLDIAAAEGTPVLAAGNAKVVYAGLMKFYGNTVILDHGMGLYSFYNHMSALSVEADQMVSKGDKIGEVGSTGYSSGNHLHWNIRLFGVNVDPALFTKENSIISDMKRMMSE